MVKHESGITFGTWSAAAGGSQAPFEFGMALPENALTTDSTEYIGLLVSLIPLTSKTRWLSSCLDKEFTSSSQQLTYRMNLGN